MSNSPDDVPIEGQKPMTEKRSWQEFREAGLLWWVNRALHVFGWAIVVQVDEKGDVTDVYPAVCGYRGFGEESEERGFARLRRWMQKHADKLVERLDTE